MKFFLCVLIAILFINCQSRSDCFGGRIIVKTIQDTVKFETWSLTDSIFISQDGKRYIPCNFHDNLINHQDYLVELDLLKIKSTEKWIGNPCEIKQLEVISEQNFDILEIGSRTIFTGGGGKTEMDETITVGIEIEKISEHIIAYKFFELLNWKRNREIEGKARLDITGVYKMDIPKVRTVAAIKFIDSKNQIDILISKDAKLNTKKAKVYEKKTSQFSGLMYNK